MELYEVGLLFVAFALGSGLGTWIGAGDAIIRIYRAFPNARDDIIAACLPDPARPYRIPKRGRIAIGIWATVFGVIAIGALTEGAISDREQAAVLAEGTAGRTPAE